MKKNVGILYDNISGNTGDVAIGLSLRKIMRSLNLDFDELIPGNYNPLLYDSIIIGGGHLLRENQDFFYDKFKIRGKNILNSMGIVGFPKDLEYLDEYKYVSFRSTGDKNKINYLKKQSNVVPCTTMLLDDLKSDVIKLDDNSIGIHLIPNFLSVEEEHLLINWLSSLPYTIYFIPITHYNYDYNYMDKICSQLNNAYMLPIMKPLEIFTLIGKIHYFISCSLHGSIFSYIHNVPFILMDQEKSRFFLEDRHLEKYLFNSVSDIINLSEAILNKPIDYSSLITKDKHTLSEHVKNIKNCVGANTISINKNSADEKLDILCQTNYQIHMLQTEITVLKSKLDKTQFKSNEIQTNLNEEHSKLKEAQFKIDQLTTRNNSLTTQINCLNNNLMVEHNKNSILEAEKNKILQSKGWKLLKFIYKFENLFPNFQKHYKTKRD